MSCGRAVLVLLLSVVSACVAEPRTGDAGAGGRDAGTASLEPDVPEPSAPKKPRAPRGPWLDDERELERRFPAYGVTLYYMAHVYEAPHKRARAVGYLRRGARFRASEEVSRKDCPRGWFEVPGGGFVCQSDGFVIDSKPPRYDDAPTLAALWDALPYPYAKVLAADVPQFVRLPSVAEEREVSELLSIPDAGVPDGEDGDAAEPPPLLASLLRVRMQPGFYVSVDGPAPSDGTGRKFTRTVRGGFVREEQLIPAELPPGIGVALGQRYRLPIAFVYRGGAPALRLDPLSGEAVKVGYDLAIHGVHALTGEAVVRSGRRYYVTSEGLLLRDTAVRVVERVERPRTVPRKERWIRVDLDRQTLTAYDGDTPVFATLVSSGLPDHATPAGIYRLHAKHVTATMADDLAADGPYSIEDVPWTMYFYGSYALHAAFWHRRFGHPRSHGCVNLAPRDARWLFFWTLPELPSAFHGVLADVGEGTTVVLDSGVAYAIES